MPKKQEIRLFLIKHKTQIPKEEEEGEEEDICRE